MTTQRPATIGLVELPELGLFDVRGHNWAQAKASLPLVSKQILLSNLQGHGYDAQLVNMKTSDDQSEYGQCGHWRREQHKFSIPPVACEMSITPSTKAGECDL